MDDNPISLCEQIAKKYRKDIKYGDWYWSTSHNKVLLAIDGGIKTDSQECLQVFKIWTIKDCLEFLIEKGWDDINIEIAPHQKVQCIAEKGQVDKGWEQGFEGLGETTLIACLKVVLAVLEEER